MATTYTLRRKLFAVSAGHQQLVEEISQGGGKAGYKKLYQTYQKQGKAAEEAMGSYAEQYKKWAEAQGKAGAKDVSKAAFGKTAEGQAAIQSARQANLTHRGTAEQIINKGNTVKGKPAATNASQAAAQRSKQIAQQKYNSGAKGLGRWMKNTWNRGPGGKAALIGGGIALAGGSVLAAKGAFGGKKNNNAQQY